MCDALHRNRATPESGAPPPQAASARRAVPRPARAVTAGDAPELRRKSRRLSVAADPMSVRHALLSLHGTVLRAGVPLAVAENFQIVLAEMLNNAVEHGFGGPTEARIALRVTISADGIDCALRDKGIAFPGGALPPGDLPLTGADAGPGAGAGAAISGGPAHPGAGASDSAPALPEGGFGWHLIRALAEDLHYRRRADRNELRFRLPLGAELPPEPRA